MVSTITSAIDPQFKCGVEGRACRRQNACNSALCSHCPVAEEFFAKRDGILSLKYKDTNNPKD